jgi:hypothetical protein
MNSMNSPISQISRGLAVLALIALAPCAKALEITLTAPVTTQERSYFGNPFPTTNGFTWNVPQFNPAMGELLSVSVGMYVSGTVSVVEINAWSQTPVVYTPRVYLTALIEVTGLPDTFGIGAMATGSPQILNPNQASQGFAATLTDGTSRYVTSPSLLSIFEGEGTIPVYLSGAYSGAQSYGNVSSLLTIQGHVTYNYRAVPSGGNTLAMSVLAFGTMVLVHRRRQQPAKRLCGQR